ncbi:MAG TPA: DUF1330 domain-containing protein [Gemmatimonadaceae bacterium]|nr:DUF1330 domain-containing protein [Gemmatimonadaceae bacterium]
MPAYIIVQISVRDPDTYERYKLLTPPSIAAYGGRYIVRGGATETLEGSWSPRRLVVLEFPSVERARAWWGSPEYAGAKALRQQCADTEMLLVDGLPPVVQP